MKKKCFAIILAAALAVLLLPTVSFAAGESAIQLGTGGIGTDDKVYFGKYSESGADYDVPWLVLQGDALSQTSVAQGTTVIPLLSQYLLGSSQFRDSAPGYYPDSILRSTMAGIYNNFHSLEQGAAVDTTLLKESMNTTLNDLSGQKLFPLSYSEAYRFGWRSEILIVRHITNPGGNAAQWWLRLSDSGYSANTVNAYGNQKNENLDLFLGVRPAFNLDTSKVLFTSAAAGGKDCTLGTLNANLTPSGATDWKLTLSDSSRSGFDAGLNSASSGTVTAGDSVLIDYAGAKTGTNEYLSAMIVNGSNTVLYYGRLKNIAAAADASGTQAITIPVALPGGTHTLKIFNEQYNGDKKTDYASGSKDVTLTVTAADAPAITTHPTAQSVIEGIPATFSVVATGTAPLSYQWQVKTAAADWADVSGATSASYTIPDPTTAMNDHQFRCVVSNGVSPDAESNAATLTVSAQTYAVTVNSGTGGGDYAADAEVTITAATAPAGQQFKEWTASDGVIFADSTAATTTFSMPAQPVTVTATYEDIPPATYAITYAPNGGSGTMAGGRATAETPFTLPACGFTAPTTNQQFKEWAIGSDGSATRVQAGGSYTFTANTTVYAIWETSPTPGPARTGYNTGSTYTGNEYPGSFAGGTLTVQGPCANLTSVMVDNVILTRGQDYAVGCGSTVITFTPAYLASLKDGTHTAKVQFTDGRYMGTFATPLAGAAAVPIADVPATGVTQSAAFVWFLCGVCCLLARTMLDKRRRKDSSLRLTRAAASVQSAPARSAV